MYKSMYKRVNEYIGLNPPGDARWSQEDALILNIYRATIIYVDILVFRGTYYIHEVPCVCVYIEFIYTYIYAVYSSI